MSLLNQFAEHGCNRAELKTFLQLVSPFAPHIAEELWEMHGYEGVCSLSQWPAYDEEKCKDSTVEMAIQINGKLRGTMAVPADSDDASVQQAAMEHEKVQKALADGGTLVKTIVVKNKLINLIVK